MKINKKIFVVITVLISGVIYLGVEFDFLPQTDQVGVKIISVLATLIFGTYFSELWNAFFVTKSKPIGTYSDLVLKDNLSDLEENVKTESSEELSNVINNTSLRYIENLECIHYRNNNPTNQSKEIALELISRHISGKNNYIILGDGGAGKTTLIHNYIVKSNDENSPNKVPIHLSLSKWDGSMTFDAWLASEAAHKYDIDESVILALIHSGNIIPCLDGLDEVSQELRKSLAQTIRAYALSKSLIFSCRKLEFQALPDEFKKEFLICELQPLSPEQIQKSLGSLSSKRITKWMLKQGFVQTPLMLNVVATVVNEFSREDERQLLRAHDDQEISQIIWEKYDEVMFQKKLTAESTETEVSLSSVQQKKLRYWFVWLSQNVRGENPEFFIEQLQPQWLTSTWDRLLYFFVSRIVLGVLISISVGLFLSDPFDFIGVGVLSGFLMSFISFAKQRMLSKMFKAESPELKTQNQIQLIFSRKKYLDAAIHLLIVALILGIANVMYLGFTVPRKSADLIFNGYFATTEAYVGIFVTLFFATIFGLRNQWQAFDYDIRPVERVVPSWKQFFIKGLRGGIILATFLFLRALIIDIFLPTSTFGLWLTDKDNAFLGLYGPLFGFIAGFFFGFPIFAVFGSLNANELALNREDKLNKRLFYSNYGIKRSLKNALFYGAVAWLFLGAIFVGYMWIYTGTQSGIFKSLKEAFGGAILASLWFGAADFIQHWSLRLTAYLRGYSPLNWSKFLQYGRSLTFIKQSGASFIFYHRTLREFYQQMNSRDAKLQRFTKPLFGRLAFVAIFVLLFFLIAKGIYDKQSGSKFWPHESAGLKHIIHNPESIVALESMSFALMNKGFLRVKSYGKFKVGNFTGYIYPSGTETGFLGMPIGDTYDIIEDYPHGALLYKLSGEQFWKALDFSEEDEKWPWSTKNSLIKVQQSDTIQFLINDSEWQNNIGKITIELECCGPELQ